MRALMAVDLGGEEELVDHDLKAARRWLAGAVVDLLFVDDPLPDALVPPNADPELAKLLTTVVNRRDDVLRKRLDRLLTRSGMESGLGHVCREPDIADAIVARAVHYDLVVVGTHGRRGLDRAWLGSVAEKVVRASPVPVLVVRPTPIEGNARMLAAVDGWDPGAERVLAEVGRWAARLGATVDLLHAVELPVGPHPTAGIGARQIEALLAGAEHRVQALAERLPPEARGVPRVVWGEPSLAVAAASPQYELVIVGTHGRSGLARLWLGSVAERTVRRSAGPVLVVPTAG